MIAINGYPGAGKDTIGLIIQWLLAVNLNNNSLTFREFAGRGEHYRVIESDRVIKKFATPLKRMTSILTGLSLEELEDRELKEKVIIKGTRVFLNGRPVNYIFGTLDDAVSELEEKMSSGLISKGIIDVKSESVNSSSRDVNRILAKAIDENISGSVFTNLLMDKYRFRKREWIITDLRKVEEYKEVIKYSPILIKVIRPSLNDVYKEHPVENLLKDYDFKYTVINNQLENTIEQVKEILIEEKLIK